MACVERSERWRTAWAEVLLAPRSLLLGIVGVSTVGLSFVAPATANSVLIVLGVLTVVFGIVLPAANEITMTPTKFAFKPVARQRRAGVETLYSRFGAALERVAQGLGAPEGDCGWVNEALSHLLDYEEHHDEHQMYLRALCELVQAAANQDGLRTVLQQPGSTDGPLSTLDFEHRAVLVIHHVAGLDTAESAGTLHCSIERYKQILDEITIQSVRLDQP
jgi:hypothetical protein